MNKLLPRIILIGTIFCFAAGCGDIEKENIQSAPNKNLTGEQKDTSRAYFAAVEDMPIPIGGIKGIMELIKYPEKAKRDGVQGRVLIKAFIDENGEVLKTEVLKGIGTGCDSVAVSAVEQTKFIPGKQNGRSVKVQVVVPIIFKLQ